MDMAGMGWDGYVEYRPQDDKLASMQEILREASMEMDRDMKTGSRTRKGRVRDMSQGYRSSEVWDGEMDHNEPQDDIQTEASRVTGYSLQRGNTPAKNPIRKLVEPIFKNPAFKTVMCHKWMQQGICPYTDHCQFAHGLQELRGNGRHPLWRTQPCRNMKEKGRCPFGKRCAYVHPAGTMSIPGLPNNGHDKKPDFFESMGRNSKADWDGSLGWQSDGSSPFSSYGSTSPDENEELRRDHFHELLTRIVD